jgi:hypothetical protein
MERRRQEAVEHVFSTARLSRQSSLQCYTDAQEKEESKDTISFCWIGDDTYLGRPNDDRHLELFKSSLKEAGPIVLPDECEEPRLENNLKCYGELACFAESEQTMFVLHHMKLLTERRYTLFYTCPNTQKLVKRDTSVCPLNQPPTAILYHPLDNILFIAYGHVLISDTKTVNQQKAVIMPDENNIDKLAWDLRTHDLLIATSLPQLFRLSFMQAIDLQQKDVLLPVQWNVKEEGTVVTGLCTDKLGNIFYTTCQSFLKGEGTRVGHSGATTNDKCWEIHRIDVDTKQDMLLNVRGVDVNAGPNPEVPFAIWGCCFHCPSNQLFFHAGHSILRYEGETSNNENLFNFSKKYLLPCLPSGFSISVANLIAMYLFSLKWG